MTEKEKLRDEFIMNYGHAYKSFGLSKLIGHVVALLMFHTKPISLEDISKSLNRSKGPISQTTGRLRDKRLIRRVWQPTSRKDFYEIEPEIFENAFRNNMDLNKKNIKIAEHYLNEIKTRGLKEMDGLKIRLKQMAAFYHLMEKHNNNFLEEWQIERKKYIINE